MVKYILVVGSTPWDRLKLGQTLIDEVSGVVIRYASDGEEAIRQIRGGLDVDVIVANLCIPENGGGITDDHSGFTLACDLYSGARHSGRERPLVILRTSSEIILANRENAVSNWSGIDAIVGKDEQGDGEVTDIIKKYLHSGERLLAKV
ncbi:TPA: hypothetical protein DDW69_03515 [candidate division CPR2 bacterium]|uniref:Response regulatory domain-containing protein n=1 Tax=candidate division CPR2 bacterium GW2011_GWC1_41_48 TaxID=1618344 RepID=A0A0G0Z7P0_UNCC2|nr:MAG: hypothetical protein UT47_C0003G0104 [candidate division CPR2 bacterium GW2011_GWC2_39_35]KKR27782.1 MAG: hypothetical protein UT59_C0044G0009 [candidate division CPR2 bacterium GW2011_GWD1_39_7]KKR28799.1 MAG: hypothetical protein UT60_C0012G0007 [candidate division CPR2 bacterium GW2011_GWD2_39_7]KKS09043.1 MAG: hypothetical protein UU65_C0003G0098 [candidate division CPR2 bacterium GW2011_GWC1_41_48]OGB59800.1 MAG: hypothetical protein A2Y27_00040 [candidate division CPR2 bacterium G